MKKLFLILCLLLNETPYIIARNLPAIIPAPLTITEGTGTFSFNAQTRVICTESARNTAELWAETVRRSTGFPLPVEVRKSAENQKNAICFSLPKDGTGVQDETYTLNVTSKNIVIRAKGAAGLFYGTQTLRQLLPAAIESAAPAERLDITVPNLYISDKPRFGWRGFMLDVSRTFYSIEVLKKYLDIMALYKLNTFHLHLTDDQGWRMEIKKYPLLTSEKATRFPEEFKQSETHSGFYTQEELKDLVRYAAERHIEVVPEIDIPGHSWPVLINYPELAVCDNLYPDYIMPFVDTYNVWGNQFTPNTLDPTKEAVYRFLEDVFAEVTAIFPSKYIHFGGDEVRHAIWKKEPHIQAFMKDHNMERIEEVQSYFVQRVSKIITEKGRQPMGWNDILIDAGNLSRNTAIMSWIGSKAVKQAAQYGFPVVAVPYTYLYFDICQADRNDGVLADLSYGNTSRLEDVYKYNPTDGLTSEEQRCVFGVQANLWSAVPQNVKDITVQTFPRLLALAEIAWTPATDKDYKAFEARVEKHLPRLDALKVDYYRPGGHIIATWQPSDIRHITYRTLEWDVTHKVYANGRAMAGLYYTKGKNPLNIRKMQLLEDGKVIAEDNHRGFADANRATGKRKTYLYYLPVDRYNPNARYTLQAEVSGYNGTDSYGNVIFSLSPYQPFAATEADKRKQGEGE